MSLNASLDSYIPKYMIASLCSINNENIKLFLNTESRACTNQPYGLGLLLLSSNVYMGKHFEVDQSDLNIS